MTNVELRNFIYFKIESDGAQRLHHYSFVNLHLSLYLFDDAEFYR